MNKLLIELYTVTDQQIYDDNGNVQSISNYFNQLVQQFNNSFMKNKVELRMIDMLKETYDEKQVRENLSNGQLLPWVYFNGELTFYNGISESMIFQEAMKSMTYKVVKKRGYKHNKNSYSLIMNYRSFLIYPQIKVLN